MCEFYFNFYSVYQFYSIKFSPDIILYRSVEKVLVMWLGHHVN